MKLFISADIEGCAGTTLNYETHKEEPAYQKYAKQMTDEVVAVCEAALAAGVVEPLAAAHSHAVVPRQALVASRGEELFSPLTEKGLQIDACGAFLLRFGEIDKFAHGMSTSVRSGAR